MITGLDHIQLAIPKGAEEEARRFYGGLLGLSEIAKPSQLAGRGGLWFRGPGLELHLGVETPFRPARKAHPAFVVSDLAHALKALSDHVTEPESALPGIRRVFVADPFGNRIEILQRI